MLINILFYMCLLFPIFRIRYELLNLIKDSFSYFMGYGGINPRYHQEDVCLVDLPIIRYDDLQIHRHTYVERMCFICSTDYDKEDVLCQLSRCGHVFHSDCVGKLLHMKRNSCPYCHAPVFSGLASSHLSNVGSF
ncbi:RING-H2 finger protein ATL18 [Artemisia annua]|uniref:RING-H2 finger protein ATL18 n=1 Tax=Artemisia annua TaxID=35608 RepID=A0A2U1NUA4_ARTAN|nr:RING-H2 finger protein ATL18 [Artemisia annua]